MSTLNKYPKDKTNSTTQQLPSNHSTSSAIMVQTPHQHQHQQQRFSSNLCAVLNDPRKDRAKINHLFTKTWGSDFVDSERLIPNITAMHPTTFSMSFKQSDFKEYLGNMREVKFLKITINALFIYILKGFFKIKREASNTPKTNSIC
jgi:hypothetical protein